MNKIKSSFIGIFKIGDNINYNLNVLNTLYKSLNNLPEQDQPLLEKPITLILVAICEAIIYDFIYRSKEFTREGVAGLSLESLEKLRSSNSWSLEKKIQLIKNLNILNSEDRDVYSYLENLASLRNRIHIQNEYQNFEEDEQLAFKKSRRIEAERMVELLMKKFLELYPRPPHISMSEHVADFELPWTPHFN